MRKHHLWMFAGLLSLSGCFRYNWQTEVIKQASFDHNCPTERIAITADSGDEMARSVRMNVCGQPRVYRDVGGSQIYLWHDMTDTAGGDQAIP